MRPLHAMLLSAPILWATLSSCGREDTPSPPYVALDPVAHAVRASMVLRGIRPTVDELDQVRRDPHALEGLVDTWVASPEFALVAKDMYAEWLLVRADVIDPLPALGTMDGHLMHEMSFSLAEAPLELVKYVIENDRPLTEILTSDIAMADPIVAGVYGLAYDPAGPEWQPSHWNDQRPAAGLLVDSELWRRHESAGSNFNRLRANLVADVFLCSAFATRDVVVEGGITISDEFQVAEATRTQPECMNCHTGLDPFAAYFFGFKKQVKRSTVAKGFRADCDTSPTRDPFKPYSESEYCYPLEPYSTEDEDWWQYWALPAPGFYGQPGQDLEDLGQKIADDPRFAQCTARRFYGWMTESDPHAVPLAFAEQLQDVFVASGYSARALAKAVVLSDAFAAVAPAPGVTPDVPPAGIQIARPEQVARSIEDITGFAWVVNPDYDGCDSDRDAGDGTDCWGRVDVMRSDRFGYRAMAGGIDGYAITTPIHSPTPPRELVWEGFASEASGYVVKTDFAQPDRAQRRLMTEVEPTDTGRDAIVRQIVAIYPRILGRFPTADAPEVQDLADLWQAELDNTGGDVVSAWSLTLTAMFVDPDATFF
ncbi:MAG: DUF1585 domain-containing protein [Myxococcota bacterium]